MRAHPHVGEIEGRLGSDDAKALAHEVQALVNSFNQSIQEEAKDRKYRFVVKRVRTPKYGVGVPHWRGEGQG